MSAVSYKIRGGDFENDGAAARCVKEQLKKVGADPAVVRRAMVAVYEAEMNVVIHAEQGELRAALHDGQLDVEVVDEGPGIPDVARAMTPGFSTASAAARQLGFGAGMGLPNIQKNSDRFAIESAVGKGTRISFTLFLKPQALYGSGVNSLHISAEKCRQSLNCIRACPTQALRLLRGKPQLLEYLCIDCAACIAVCGASVFAVEGLPRTGGEAGESAASELQVPPATTLVVPSPCLAQFGAGVSPQQALHELMELGFVEVRTTEPWERALQAAVCEYARLNADQRATLNSPVISPTCPAVSNLIETKYPVLIPAIAPFVSAVEAAHAGLDGRKAISVVLCPCQRTALTSGGASSKPETILPSVIRAAVLSRLKAKQATACDAAFSTRAPGLGQGVPARAPGLGQGVVAVEQAGEHGILRVTGLRHVMKVLDAIENGLTGDLAVLELYACDQGCFGSPLLAEEPFLARHRWEQAQLQYEAKGEAVRRSRGYSPRRGLRLDTDMARAMAKLAKIDKLTRSLPGCDCAICGAPTCAALAEDIVLGRATRDACLREQQDAAGQGRKEAADQEKA